MDKMSSHTLLCATVVEIKGFGLLQRITAPASNLYVRMICLNENSQNNISLVIFSCIKLLQIDIFV